MAVSAEDAARPPRAVSLGLALALSIGFLVFAAVASVLVISGIAGARNTIGLLNEKAVSLVQTIEDRVRNHLDPAAQQAAFLARQIRNGRLDPDDTQSFNDALLGALAGTPQVGAIVYWTTDLRVKGIAQLPDGQIEFIARDDRGDDFVREVLAQMRLAEQPFWGEPAYPPDQRDTFVNLRHPVRDERGEFLGFLVVVVSMRDLSEFVTEIGDRFGATAFILHGEDRVLAHPNLMSRHPDLGPDNPTIAIERVGDLVLSNLRSATYDGPFNAAADQGVRVGKIDFGEDGHVAFTSTVTDFGETPWIIGAHLPIDQVNQEARRLVFSISMAILVLLGSVVAAIVLGRVLARPIRRVAAGTAQIGRLDLGTIEDLPASRIRELNDQASAFNNMLHGLRWFETYVPKRLVQRLIRHEGERDVTHGERHLTVLFTDIVGFTATTEHLSPVETEAFLNHHFALLASCVEAEEGTIDKFIGDALMAFWGAPDDQSDHATRACRAAREIVVAITQDNERRRRDGLAPVRIRIGIHTDRVLVGNIGAPGRMNYTIVGDGVNTGQRIESLGKELDDGSDVVVLVSAATAEAVDQRQIRLHQVGRFQVKGKEAPLEVFRLPP